MRVNCCKNHVRQLAKIRQHQVTELSDTQDLIADIMASAKLPLVPLLRQSGRITPTSTRSLSRSTVLSAEQRFKLVVVGGGAGGCGTVNKFVNKFGEGEVAVIGQEEAVALVTNNSLPRT